MESTQDVFIIGGGINGAGIAADAAGRGLSVTLCEQEDLASGTSSASTKLIHGGLRYLELFEFGLVKKALQEREVLLKKAPHLIQPLEFILPYQPHLRAKWMIRLGLFLYDHLAKRIQLPASRKIKLENDPALRKEFSTGFSYYDCFTDDARLVIENALSAEKNGAKILTRTAFISAVRENDYWKITIKNKNTQQESIVFSKTLINVAGPYVKEVNEKIKNPAKNIDIKLVKGSHIVVPKLYEGKHAYILQHRDQRITFAIPYQKNFTLIGTTDLNVIDPQKTSASENEVVYLCEISNQYFKQSIFPSHVIWSYSGNRCLQDQALRNASTTTREYRIQIDANENNTLPLITIIGGKLTSFRLLAEEAVNKLKPYFPEMGASWTRTTALPGGKINQPSFEKFYISIKQNYSWLPTELGYRYAKNYGALLYDILKDKNSLTDLGMHFGADLYEAEINYLVNHEWAQTIDDILWRRTKLGLISKQIDLEKLKNYIVSIN